MSASAKLTERAFKSLLAVVLAVSLCPLMPAGQAKAQEVGEGGNEMGALSVSVDAQSSDADDAAAPQSGESGDPIVDWTMSGTARWMIDASGCLTIAPIEGEQSGELEDWRRLGKTPWYDDSSLITSAKVEGTIAVSTARGMFYNCSSLESLDLSGLDASGATDMFRMFYNCSSLRSLDLSGLDTSNVSNMTFMFDGCSSLESLDLSGLDASRATDMFYMFHNCSSLESLDLSGLDASSATDMRSMFKGCSSLESLDLSGLDASSATNMSYMFSGCSSLSSLDLSGLDSSKVTDMSRMFGGCSSLSSLDLPLRTSKVTSMSYMFWDCSSLSSLDLSSFDTSKVVYMNNMFSGCSSLSSLDLSGLDASSATDMSCMFDGCSSLKSLDMSGLDASGATDMSFMFDGCSSLESLDLSGLDASGATDMSYMFYNCSSLKSLDMSGLDTSGATDMRSMFYNCSSLRSLDLSSFDTSKVTRMSYMFYNCSSLTSLDLSSFDTWEVAYMSCMFDGCSSLRAVKLGESFVFAGKTPTRQCDLPTPSGVGYTGLWLSSADGEAYAPDAVPDKVAATYTAQVSRTKADISGALVSDVPDQTYTGAVLKPAVEVAYGGERLAEGFDYTVSYSNNVYAGEATVTVRGVGGYSGEATRTFEILPAAMDRGMVSGVPAEMTATGSQLAPEPVVTFNGERLVEGRDYIVSYGDNVEPGVGAGSVAVSAVEGGNFTGSVTVYFDIEKKTEPAPVFPDVDYGEWYAPGVTFVAGKGLITGYAANGHFGVGDPLTRGQLATILWRNACPEEAAAYDASTARNETGLSGVSDGEYYTAAANWAVREGIITGFERADGTYDFAASSPVSFEQLITILSRLCAAPGEVAAAGSDLSGFVDGDEASSWAAGAIAWAAKKGLVGGYDTPSGKVLAPGEEVARERVAVVLMRAFDLGIME